MSLPTVDLLTAALATVQDPEIKRPITDLGMVESVDVDESGLVRLTVLLTVAGCPLKDTITRDVNGALRAVEGVTDVDLTLGVMTAEQRAGLKEVLSDGKAQREITFSQPGSLTKVFAIASGKGGVGKSSVTVNLALAMAKQGLRVGVVDADIYGHSVPAMLGVADARPTKVDDLIMPVPTASGVSVISIGMLKPRRDQVVAWRGPMLDRALVQMLADVYWGDLDVLLLDLPPGTGDVAISLGQHLPGAEVVVVTTPQEAAAEVAERAGTMASMMHQRVVGVVENMSFLPCPHCAEAGPSTGSRCSAPAAATGSPRPCPRASATTSRCSAGSRSTSRCARAATPASRSSTRTRPPRRPWSSLRSRSGCPGGSARRGGRRSSSIRTRGAATPGEHGRGRRVAACGRVRRSWCRGRCTTTAVRLGPLGLFQGHSLFVFERFDAGPALDLIEQRAVAFAWTVPTMLLRMEREQQSPRGTSRAWRRSCTPEGRARRRSSAPGSPRLGPPLMEFSARSEATASRASTASEWLERPGTVGRPWRSEVPSWRTRERSAEPGEVGEIYMRRTEPRRPAVPLHRRARAEGPAGGWYSVGDLGWLDDAAGCTSRTGDRHDRDRRRQHLPGRGRGLAAAAPAGGRGHMLGLADGGEAAASMPSCRSAPPPRPTPGGSSATAVQCSRPSRCEVLEFVDALPRDASLQGPAIRHGLRARRAP